MNEYRIVKAYVNQEIEYRVYFQGLVVKTFETYEEAEDYVKFFDYEP